MKYMKYAEHPTGRNQLERLIADEKELRHTLETHIDFEEWQPMKLTLSEYFRLTAELIDAMGLAERNR